MWQQGQQGQGNRRESQFYGGSGGGHHAFDQRSNLSLVAARGGCGSLLDRIQFLFVDVNTGQYVESENYGGAGGGPWQFQAPPGQWINKIHIGCGSMVDSVTFETNQGVRSERYGGGGGGQHTYQTHGRITGVEVRCGGAVDALRFVAME